MLTLVLLDENLSIYRFETPADLPDFAHMTGFVSLTRTAEEISLVCLTLEKKPENCRIEPGWRALKVAGPLDFSLTGVLASLATPLAAANIPIFVISTFDTDYLLVKQEALAQTIEVLENVGHKMS